MTKIPQRQSTLQKLRNSNYKTHKFLLSTFLTFIPCYKLQHLLIYLKIKMKKLLNERKKVLKNHDQVKVLQTMTLC